MESALMENATVTLIFQDPTVLSPAVWTAAPATEDVSKENVSVTKTSKEKTVLNSSAIATEEENAI